MASRFSGVGTVVLTAVTATCGLFMLTGVAPTGSNDVPLPAASPTSVDPSSTTTEPGPPVDDTSPTSSSTTSTTSSTSSTSSTSTTTLPVTPIPLSVSASNTVVGAGGSVSFDGTCAVGGDGPIGPVVVWVIGETTDVVDTGVTSASWSYTWTAPTAESDFGSFTFQFWCGDPTGFDGGYPADLQQHVDMVASAAPTTTALVESLPPTAVIPETD